MSWADWEAHDAKLAAILADVAYRPGWRFEVAGGLGTFVQPDDGEGYLPVLVVSADVPDVHDPDQTTRINQWQPIPPPMLDDPDMVLGVVDETVARLEAHERHEWLRYRGAHVVDPHPPDCNGIPGFASNA